MLIKFNQETVGAVWIKGRIIPGYNPDQYRQDACNAWIEYAKYGDRNSIFGWEVDHINPSGSDQLTNLQPLQWENNLAKSDGLLKCVVTSKENKNIHIQ